MHDFLMSYVLPALGTLLVALATVAAARLNARFKLGLTSDKLDLFRGIAADAVHAAEQRAGILEAARPDAHEVTGEQKKRLAMEIADKIAIDHGVPEFGVAVLDHLVEAAVARMNATAKPTAAPLAASDDAKPIVDQATGKKYDLAGRALWAPLAALAILIIAGCSALPTADHLAADRALYDGPGKEWHEFYARGEVTVTDPQTGIRRPLNADEKQLRDTTWKMWERHVATPTAREQ